VSKAEAIADRLSPPRGVEGLIATFYGDDFTGSTDVMEAFVRNGMSCVLFLSPPEPKDLERVGPVDVIGVAGISRSWTPEEMASNLPGIFKSLKALNAPLFHYKLCSTFDSSPTVGSIGKALEIARETFGPQTVPIVVGAPILKRYTVFGNLFATADGVTHRIDRHPTMAHHPVTPMNESDIRKHLSQQTELRGELLDYLHLLDDDATVNEKVDSIVSSQPAYLLLDVLEEKTLRASGRQLARLIESTWVSDHTSRVVFGSSGVEYALAEAWEPRSPLSPALDATEPFEPAQTLVVIGSRSPATKAQVDEALRAGFSEVAISPSQLLGPTEQAHRYVAKLAEEVLALMSEGDNVIVTTPEKSEDVPISGNVLAQHTALMVKLVCESFVPERLVVAGGDTSGHVATALGIRSLRISALMTPGAPLCDAEFGPDSNTRFQVCLKGGQVGGPDYFTRIAGLTQITTQPGNPHKERAIR
jgi:3-oxoisoapionate kinase